VPGRARRSGATGRGAAAFRGLVYQIIAIALIGLVVWFSHTTRRKTCVVRGIQSGFGLPEHAAGFDIGEPLFNYDALDRNWRAFLVGIGNTLAGRDHRIVMTTVLGALLGIGRFSRNALVRDSATAMSSCSNIPVLLQLLNVVPGVHRAAAGSVRSGEGFECST